MIREELKMVEVERKRKGIEEAYKPNNSDGSSVTEI